MFFCIHDKRSFIRKHNIRFEADKKKDYTKRVKYPKTKGKRVIQGALSKALQAPPNPTKSWIEPKLDRKCSSGSNSVLDLQKSV